MPISYVADLYGKFCFVKSFQGQSHPRDHQTYQRAYLEQQKDAVQADVGYLEKWSNVFDLWVHMLQTSVF